MLTPEHRTLRGKAMSRSRRKTPIVGHARCRSERQDKKAWHRRWRSSERTALASASPGALEAHLPRLEKQSSDVWAMGKDGRAYWSLARQKDLAEALARKAGRTPQEQASVSQRLLRMWMGK